MWPLNISVGPPPEPPRSPSTFARPSSTSCHCACRPSARSWSRMSSPSPPRSRWGTGSTRAAGRGRRGGPSIRSQRVQPLEWPGGRTRVERVATATRAARASRSAAASPRNRAAFFARVAMLGLDERGRPRGRPYGMRSSVHCDQPRVAACEASAPPADPRVRRRTARGTRRSAQNPVARLAHPRLVRVEEPVRAPPPAASPRSLSGDEEDLEAAESRRRRSSKRLLGTAISRSLVLAAPARRERGSSAQPAATYHGTRTPCEERARRPPGARRAISNSYGSIAVTSELRQHLLARRAGSARAGSRPRARA